MQLFAMLTMLIDHVGLILYPDEQIWRIIGRIAFPLYAYAIVLGFQRTRSIQVYFIRLVIIAVISQLPYMWAFNTTQINVVGTFVICLFVIWGMDVLSSRWLSGALVLSGIAILELISFDYGSYALLLILIYKYTRTHLAFGLHIALNMVFWVYQGWEIQAYSLISTFVIMYVPLIIEVAEDIRIPRWLWRSFYPLHLAILALMFR
jgi:hypothetical protein